jgi:hypothetical protein
LSICSQHSSRIEACSRARLTPNPLKYEWQANAAQVDFALAALE